MKTKMQTIKRVFKYLGKYDIYLGISLFLSVLIVAGQLFIPVLQGKAIDKIISSGNVDLFGIKKFLFWIVLTMIAVAVFQWIMDQFNNKITFAVVRDIRRDAFDKIQKLPIEFMDKNQSGEITSRIIVDVDQFSDGLILGFSQFFTGIITILGTLIFMFYISWEITLVVVLITPLSFFVASFLAKKTYTMFKLQSEARGEQTSFIDDILSNIKLVQAYSYEDKVVKDFDKMNDKLQKYSLKAIFYSSITNPSTRFVNNMVYALVCLVGAFSVMNGNFTIGSLTVMLSYANRYTKPFNEISGVVTELQNALACADRILNLIDEKPMDFQEKEILQVEKGEGEIMLKNISFSYDKQKELIQNLNLKIQAGEKIAIVGPTGCGKTTLINLLMRFYEVDDGDILIEHKNIQKVTRESLRNVFGMVLQDTWLRYGTIKENIGMGKPDATDQEVIQAAKAANAHSFIKRLPDGYNTVIEEDGGSLSQGQKQLLCIARVMLREPAILILDEATSSIDTRTEIKIQQAFDKMMEGRTSFVVAHRLSTIQSADIILVMNHGNVIELGTHSELLALNGFYKELYENQFL